MSITPTADAAERFLHGRAWVSSLSSRRVWANLVGDLALQWQVWEADQRLPPQERRGAPRPYVSKQTLALMRQMLPGERRPPSPSAGSV
jgi:hypothetical protein